MAIWKEPAPAKNSSSPEPSPSQTRTEPMSAAPAASPSAEPTRSRAMESVIAADLTIEGKIEGSGHVRLVGKFKGDVQVEGDLTIEKGAKVTGSVRAGTVIVGGELEGNIESASRVELLETGMINGDVKAGSLSVAAGSRMRGQAEFGWSEKEAARAPRMRLETGSTA
jgi:cytoskeletal protein CcmA (bactofilin family)